MSARQRIIIKRAGEHYPERQGKGWEWGINDPPTVVGICPTRIGAWLRARYVRRHPEKWPVHPQPITDDTPQAMQAPV